MTTKLLFEHFGVSKLEDAICPIDDSTVFVKNEVDVVFEILLESLRTGGRFISSAIESPKDYFVLISDGYFCTFITEELYPRFVEKLAKKSKTLIQQNIPLKPTCVTKKGTRTGDCFFGLFAENSIVCNMYPSNICLCQKDGVFANVLFEKQVHLKRGEQETLTPNYCLNQKYLFFGAGLEYLVKTQDGEIIDTSITYISTETLNVVSEFPYTRIVQNRLVGLCASYQISL